MSPIVVPSKRPLMMQAELSERIARSSIVIADNLYLVGIRGYYKNSMGRPKANDRGIYDDAIFLCSPFVFMSFNANVDPSTYRPGIATLAPGTWLYKVGIHGLSKRKQLQYKALVQAGPVTVHRDGGKVETGWFGINHHRGSLRYTSSEGCQTIYPTQWESYISTVESEMKRAGVKVINYILIEN